MHQYFWAYLIQSKKTPAEQALPHAREDTAINGNDNRSSVDLEGVLHSDTYWILNTWATPDPLGGTRGSLCNPARCAEVKDSFAV